MQILAENKSNSATYDDHHHQQQHHDDDDTSHTFEIIGSGRPSNSSSPVIRRPFSPLSLVSRKSFSSSSSYGKLPFQPIKLTVLKLDGSSFDISVAKNPTVAQLKLAVEEAFSHFPKHGISKVSWSHVWAQFCLTFDGQKLLHDQDTVTLHILKDGDQLQFVRHTSISYNLVKERSEKHDCDLEKKTPPSTQKLQIYMSKKEGDHHASVTQNNSYQLNNEENEDDIVVNMTCQCSWSHLLRRLFFYRRRKGHDDESYEALGT